MKINLSFLENRLRKKPRDDQTLETMTRLEATLRELTAAVSKVAKGQFQLAALVESQAETLEETAENISGSLSRSRRMDDDDLARQLEEKTLVSLLKEFLPVVDGLERILRFVTQNREINNLSFGSSLVEALRALADRTGQALAAQGVTRIPATGRPFDPYRHHAVKTVAVDDPELAGRVLEEVMSGYEARGKVVRYASVVVAVKEQI